MNLNQRVAETKGAHIIDVLDGVPYCEHILFDNPQPFDYQNDWNYLGPLVLELRKAGWNFYWDEQFNIWSWSKISGPLDERFTVKTEQNENFGTATCMAWLKEFNN